METQENESINGDYGDLVVFDDHIDLSQMSEGFLIVRKNFELLPDDFYDLGFKSQPAYHRSDDFYSIPLLNSNLQSDDPKCLEFIARSCESIEENLRNDGIKLATNDIARFLVYLTNPSTGITGYYLYETEKGKLKSHIRYRRIIDSRMFAKEFENPGLLQHLQENQTRFEEMTRG